MLEFRRGNLACLALVISTVVFGVIYTPAWAAKNVCEYQQYDWTELSGSEKVAWQTLGYSERMWDKNRDSATTDNEWDELTPAEKKAAQFLGYTQSSWNKGAC